MGRNLINQRVVETLIRNEIGFCTVAFRAELGYIKQKSQNPDTGVGLHCALYNEMNSACAPMLSVFDSLTG